MRYILVIALSILFLFQGLSSYAQTFTVNNNGDAPDNNPGDGTCETATPGECTLRAAIEEANALAGGQSIEFLPGLAGQAITIDTKLQITGPNSNNTLIIGDIAPADGKPDIRIIAGQTGINGFHILNSANNEIRGFNMVQFANGITDPSPAPIKIEGILSTGNVIASNYFGTDLNGGVIAFPGNYRAIRIEDEASNNRIGDATPTGINIISNTQVSGIQIVGTILNPTNDNQITGNIIGLDATGTIDLGNGINGIEVTNATGTIIGTIGNGRNIISGNNQEGIVLNNVSNGFIINNYIGTNITGDGALGNNGEGILLENGSAGNQVGDGTGAGRNLISGNSQQGIVLNTATGNDIIGNYIGVGQDGSTDLGNNNHGIWIGLGSSGTFVGNGLPGGGNVIAGNSGQCILVSAGPNEILGNHLGVNAAGDALVNAVPAGLGILLATNANGNIIGNGTVDGRNIISGNSTGIEIQSNNNQIKGNFIGLTANGLFNLGNNDGISFGSAATNNTIGGDNSLDEGNIISGNNGWGINVSGPGNFIFGNNIGLSAGGSFNRGNAGVGILVSGDGNTIGDAIANYGNVISDNDVGIQVNSADNTTILNNIIGLGLNGTGDRGNINDGILITAITNNVFVGDGTSSGANYISGNNTGGIRVQGASVTGVVIDNNTIGFQTDGINSIPNTGNGITLETSSSGTFVTNTIISNSTNHGIDIQSSSNSNIFSEISIYNNTGKGINNAVSPTNQPSVDNLAADGTITGTATAGATVEIFFDADDEGQTYLATVTADGSGNWTYLSNLNTDYPSGQFNITATQLDGGYTSNFSVPYDYTAAFDPFVVINTDDSGVGSLRWCIENANSTAGADIITFNIPNTDPGYSISGLDERWTIQPATDLPDITEEVTVDATSQPGGGNFRIMVDGQSLRNTGFYVRATPTYFYGLYITGFTSAGINAFVPGAGGIHVGDVGMGNVINNCGTAISTSTASNHVFKSNYIGTDETGMIAMPNTTGIGMTTASNVIIGGPLAGEGNVISGNTGRGIFINVGNGHIYEGNFIGTNATGTAAIPNDIGIYLTTGGSRTIVNNVISGNTSEGIYIQSGSSYIIQGNKIGVGLNGTDPISNDIGILAFSVLSVTNNTIGGLGAGEANIIAHNANQGIYLTDAGDNMNQFIGNSIFANGAKGIDLNGVANGNKSAPIITTYGTGSASGIGIDGDVVHLYRDNTFNVPLQGQEYLGTAIVAGGVWTIAEASIVPTDLLNATATDGLNNTSEFAINYAEIMVFEGPDNTGTQIFDTQAAVVDVGTSKQGTDLDIIFTIENKSSTTLNINSIIVEGANFIVQSYPATVDPSADANFTITLSGTNAGTFNDMVTIDSDDVDEGTFTFDITGEITPFDPFITTWSTTDGSLTIPTTSDTYTYNYNVSWTNLTNPGVNEGNLTGQTADCIIVGLENGSVYQVEISGDFPAILFDNAGDINKILTIEQWGDVAWETMQNAFFGCSNLTYNAIDTPELALVTDMTFMFRGATSFNGVIDNWDVSNVQIMFGLFSYATSFNQPLNSWNMSNVTDLTSMFEFSTSFNQPLDGWDVSNVTGMFRLFSNATSFNQPLDSWNVSSVTDMGVMFANATSFNQPLNSWNVSAATDMLSMFFGASVFDQPLNNWDVSAVTRMSYMFYQATSFNQPIDNWDVSSVTNMQYMFSGATIFDQPLGGWDISSITLMSFMLDNSGLSTDNYDATLIGWLNDNGGTETIPSGIALGAVGLTYCTASTERADLISTYSWTINDAGQECPFITTWTTTDGEITIPTNGIGYNYDIIWTNLTNGGVGDGSDTGLTGDYPIVGLANSDVYQVEITGNFPRIYFNNGTQKDKILTVEQWGDIAWTSMQNAFQGCSNLSIPALDAPDLSGVTDLSLMFAGTSSFNSDISGWDVSNVTDMTALFAGASLFNINIDSWDMSNVTTLDWMFDFAINFNQDLSSWNTSSVTSMNGTFSGAEAFNGAIGTWDVSSVNTMESMFLGAIAFNQNISGWNVGLVTIMQNMFNSATVFNQPIGGWDVSSVIDMADMFVDASSFSADLSAWDVSSVTDMKEMFWGASSFNGDISTWNVSGVTVMSRMFQDATLFNQDISSWDVSSVTEMWSMFDGAAAFDQNLGGWDISGISDLFGFFNNSGLSTANYDATLIGWNALPSLQNTVNFGAVGISYCNSVTERSNIISTYGWTITDAGQLCAFITTWTTTDGQLTIPTNGVGYNYNVLWTNLTNVGLGDGSSTGQTGDFPILGLANGDIYQVEITGDFPAIYFNFGTEVDKILSVEQWGDIQWTTMANAFYGCSNLSVPAIDTPDLSLVTDMSNMFSNAYVFNGNIDSWDVSNVTNMSYLFREAYDFNQTLNSWDVSSVTNMTGMFNNAFAFNGDISSWDISSVTIMSGMFSNAYAFDGAIGSWDVSGVNDMSNMFDNASIFNQDVSSWNVDNVLTMNSMFKAARLFNQNIGSWNVSNVTDMGSMFLVANSFNQDISLWDVSSVTNMSAMFRSANSFNQAIDGWNVSSVTDMSNMFDGSNFNQPLNSWNISSVTTLNGIFINNSDFNQPIGNWDVSNVVDMGDMFVDAIAFNQDLSSWDVSSVTNMSGTFDFATSFNQNLGSWDVSNVTNMSSMLANTNLSVANYDATLVGWNTMPLLQNGVSLGAAGLFYCNSAAERSNIISTYGWTISDDGLLCPTSPEIEIYEGIDNTGTAITDAQATTIDFGSSTIGTDITLTFAIENTGSADLNITNISISGTDYTVTGAPSIVAAGATSIFDITLSSAATGTFNETVTIDNDDSDENPFTFDITGIITALPEPEITLFEGVDNTGISITDAQVTAIDFGSSTLGTDISLSFAIENTGSADLNITNISIGGTDYTVTGAPSIVAAGATSTFDITLSSAAIGTFNETVTIDNDDSDENPFTFDITGTITTLPEPEISVFFGTDNTGTPIIDGQVAAVDFGSAIIGNDITQTFAIENIGTAVLNISQVSVAGTEFSIIASPATVALGTTETVVITLSGVTAGTFSDVLTIQSDDTDEADFDFPISGLIQSAPEPEINVYHGLDNTGTSIVDAQVTSVDFGSGTEGSDMSQTFAIENTGTAVLNISQVIVVGPNFSVTSSPASVAVGVTENFVITLSGANIGSFTDAVTIQSDDTDEATFTFPVTGTITSAGEPEIAVYLGPDNTGTSITSGQASAIDFGSVAEGTDIDQLFTIENTGSLDLTVGGINFSGGADFSTFGSVPALVSPGTSETFTIRLSGTTAGTYNDVVNIVNNDSDESTFTFSITGEIEAVVVHNGEDTGAPVIVNGQGEAIDLGQTQQFDPLAKTFVIQNPGTIILNIQSITTDNTLFELVESPTSIQPESFEIFIIELNADEVGVFNATVTIESDLGTYLFPVTGEVISVEPGAVTVFNALSPNGDGKHDYLELRGIEAYTNNSVKIMNRWGDIVFETSNYDNTSNRFVGIANHGGSGDLPPGTYYYVIRLGNSTEDISGFFTLRR